MNHHENLKIMAFVGQSDSGKSTAIEHFTAKGIPKVDLSITQIQDLVEAGQHRIVMGGSYSEDEYRSLRHEFPGELTFVTIIQDEDKDAPRVAPGHFVIDDGNMEEFAKQLDAVAEEIGFSS